eukprot:TRINITY_DN3158_c0_g1_i1.p1 TRINITY_DN3158_c0_g1~~TRINITY_DN3158_c0_g1_i1.p1  ORF type:complete len:150 (-),score=31.23 TRINITY_DN3158_c0_g1_i1:37-486(-)
MSSKKEKKDKKTPKTETSSYQPKYKESQGLGTKVLGVKYGIAVGEATGDVHIFGDLPENVSFLLEDFAQERKAAGTSKIQYLPAGEDECLLTKCDPTDYFRIQVRLSRLLLRAGWSVITTQSLPSNNVVYWQQQKINCQSFQDLSLIHI